MIHHPVNTFLAEASIKQKQTPRIHAVDRTDLDSSTSVVENSKCVAGCTFVEPLRAHER